jgi:hypothetical protein
MLEDIDLTLYSDRTKPINSNKIRKPNNFCDTCIQLIYHYSLFM